MTDPQGLGDVVIVRVISGIVAGSPPIAHEHTLPAHESYDPRAGMPKEYGPYSRKQSAEDNALMASSGELWGAAARNIYAGSEPAAKAFRENLPEGFTGLEFVTTVEPGRGGDPAQVRWPRGHPGVREVESDEVIAKVGKSRAKMLGDIVAIPVRIIKRIDE